MAEQGFLDPVFDAQRVFRAALTALAEPGRILTVDAGCVPPPGLDPAAAAIALTLCDGDTPLWLAPDLVAATDFLRFHTGAPIVTEPGAAMFAFAAAAQRPMLNALNAGTPDYPDRAATLILAVEALDDDGSGWRLSGPGIDGRRTLRPIGIDKNFASEWKANRARFPLGVDVLFAAGTRIAGLPRSTRLED